MNANKNTPSADPFTGIKLIEPTKKYDARLNTPGGEISSPNKKSRSLNVSQQMAPGELCKINLHDNESEANEAPRFAYFTKKDTVWGDRLKVTSSLRESIHLLDAKKMRATEDHDSDRDISGKNKQMNLDSKEMEEEDPFEKVRNFLEKQDL